MKELKGRLTILISAEQTRIEIRDDSSNTRFCEIILTPEQLSRCLSRQAEVECEMKVRGLDKIGLIHECKRHEFEVPSTLCFSSNKTEEAYKIALATCPKGWIPDKHFGSQDSFFKKDNLSFARVMVRRYVDPSPSTQS